MRCRLTIAVVLAVAVAAAARSRALAEDQFKVDAPDGWTQHTDAGPALASWIDPEADGFHQNLNLVSEPYHRSLDDYVSTNLAALHRKGSAIVVGPQASISTCGTHPAYFISWKSTVFGHALIFEQSLSVWFDRGYVLTYTREQGQPAIDDARAALATLCVRQV